MITTIKRPTKYEASRAVFSLLDRGWELHSPLTLVTLTGTVKSEYKHNKSRYTSRKGTSTSYWIARLKKEEAR